MRSNSRRRTNEMCPFNIVVSFILCATRWNRLQYCTKCMSEAKQPYGMTMARALIVRSRREKQMNARSPFVSLSLTPPAVYLYLMVNIVNYEYYCWENNIDEFTKLGGRNTKICLHGENSNKYYACAQAQHSIDSCTWDARRSVAYIDARRSGT